jgi:hypothetical protein
MPIIFHSTLLNFVDGFPSIFTDALQSQFDIFFNVNIYSLTKVSSNSSSSNAGPP